MPNRLAQESSPYLLQHQNNPVDWRPWGPEAIETAKREDKPIFLSIGYSACHWCHVMEHESFESAEIAAAMNESFICIKVDREERPDIDHIYMAVVQAMTRHGGWPLSVFLTPDLKPFYGGTYWPERPRGGMPGFGQVLEAVGNAWRERREQVYDQADHYTDALQRMVAAPGEATKLTTGVLDHAAHGLERSFDSHHGGFGSRPKFPHPMDLQLLLRLGVRGNRHDLLEMATLTLEKMAAGGIYDHLGGGFHRYAVDERWLVPHFEKMLYDNALLARTYVEAFQATGRDEFAITARETLDYLLREMTDAEGYFYSTQDADSEGVEGKFYVWSPDEMRAALGADAESFCRIYDVTPEGNFEGHSILNLSKPLAAQAKILGAEAAAFTARLAANRQTLYDLRLKRIAPGLDDKGLTNWNALAIDAFALAGGVFDEPRYVAAAEKAAEFVLTKLSRPDGRLLHAYRHGKAKFDAYLDDYVYLVNACVTLYETTLNGRWIDQAVRLAEIVVAQFASDDGGFFFTAADHEELIVRTKEFQDGSVPSSNGMAAAALLRLGRLTGRSDFLEKAEGTLHAFAGAMADYPGAAGQLLLSLDASIAPCPELVFAGDRSSPELQSVIGETRRRFFPQRLIALAEANASPHLAALSEGRTGASEPTLYVCEHFACQAPVIGSDAIRSRLRELSGG